MTGKDVLPERDLLEKAAAIKRFECSLLGKELKKQTSVAERQYQKFDNAFEFNKKKENKTKNKRSRVKSNLVYNNYCTFYKYPNTNEFVKRSFDSKLNVLKEFINTSSKLYEKFLNIYQNQYNKLPEDQKKMMNVLNKPENLTLDFIEDDLPPREGDKELKLQPEETIAKRMKLNPQKRKNEGTGLKILTPNKLLTRLPMSLAQVKVRNNAYT